MRDITLEDTFRHQFTTRSFSTGEPTVLAGTPVLSVLEENNATPITAGVSVSVDRASVVGLNEATVIATAANGYEIGKSYAIYISTGTVAGVNVVGEVVGLFTVELGAAFIRLGAPTGASVSADLVEIEGQTRKIKKNEAFSDLTFLMVDSTTKDPKTGLTITEEISKDAGAFATAAGTAAEIANGIYQMDATAADMNADILIFRFSATGADDTFVTIVTKP